MAVVHYRLPAPGPATLRVFDILGRTVRSIEFRAAGGTVERIELDLRTLTPGTYFYRLEADGLSETRKLIVVR